MRKAMGEEVEGNMRASDVAQLLACTAAGKSCAVVGISNIGKSALLRTIHGQGERASGAIYIYVDCNRMLGTSEQAFYELVLRCIMEQLRRDRALERFEVGLQAAYTRVTDPSSDFQVALGFNQGITGLIEELGQPLVILLDEFDEPLAEMDGRVLLNLRALRDEYPGRLSYLVATNRPVDVIRQSPAVDEFSELFAHDTLFLAPLTCEETQDFMAFLARRDGVTYSEGDLDFVLAKSGGHPGLVEAVCRLLGEVTGRPTRDGTQDMLIHRQVSERLRTDPTIGAECLKLWSALSQDEQSALLDLLARPESASPDTLRRIEQMHLVRSTPEGVEFLGELFEGFVRRQRVVERGPHQSIRLDADSGDVWVDAKLIPTLTRLEHRLLMLLYGQLGKICDKYHVVESVWGEGYIEEVDDARIEKLVARLRQKIEPDPANPRHLITVRGRGYKLVDE
jgi:hypothetical protein